MKTNLRKFISVILVVILLFSVFAIGFSATAAEFADYTPISTKEDLYNIRYNTSDKYYLTNDIVFSASDFSSGGKYYNGGNRWTPIPAFSGILDGNGYSIKYLECFRKNATSDINLGLFESVTSNGIIRNLTMTDCVFTSYIENPLYLSVYIGSVAGANYGLIDNCTNKSLISSIAAKMSVDGYAGGIAGANYGTINNCKNAAPSIAIKNDETSSVRKDIEDDVNQLDLPDISEFITNSVDFGVDSEVFSLKAENDMSDPYTYSKSFYDRGYGNVFATRFVGGIAAINNSGIIKNCENNFNISSIIEDAIVGGIVACDNGGKIENCKNTDWIATAYTSYNGTETAGGIAGETKNNSHIYACSNDGLVTSTKESGSIAGRNAGTIDNCFHTGITRGLYQDSLSGGIAGTNSGTITNSKVAGFVFDKTAGGVAGKNTGTISRCPGTSVVLAESIAGGIAAENEGKISECYFSQMVFSEGSAGGIAGKSNGKIENCYNTGFLMTSKSNSNTGGIVGKETGGSISYCYNIGFITAKNADSFSSTVVGSKSLSTKLTECTCLISKSGLLPSNDLSYQVYYATLSSLNYWKSFDFNNIWKTDPNSGYHFPQLRNVPHPNIALDTQLKLIIFYKALGGDFESGKCGDNLTWYLLGNSCLIITGTGDMYDYSATNKAPWSGKDYAMIIVTDGVTRVGNYAFSNAPLSGLFLGFDVKEIGENAFSNSDVTNIIMDRNVKKIGRNAFANCSELWDLQYLAEINMAELFYFFRILPEGNDILLNIINNSLPLDPEYEENCGTYDLIQDCSKTTINFDEALRLHINTEYLPEGATIHWMGKGAIELSIYKDYESDIAVMSKTKASGYYLMYAVAVDENDVPIRDENGNLIFDVQRVNVKYNFFLNILRWIKIIFNIVKIYT